MNRLLLALCLACSPAFAATVTLTPDTNLGCNGNVCMITGQVCLTGSPTEPMYVNIFAQNSPTQFTYMGQACGIPSHCQYSSDMCQRFSFAILGTTADIWAQAFLPDGPPLPPSQCQPNNCSTPGTRWQSSATSHIQAGTIVSVPPSSGCSAPSITYGGTLTNNSDVWSILTAPRGEVMLDGQSAAGVWGSKVTCDATGITFTNQDNGAIQCWTGSSWRNC